MANDTHLATYHRIVTQQWASKALKCEKRISVLVPTRHPDPEGQYPVLILLHGYGGTRQTWLKRTQLLEYLKGMRLLVVIPESGRRWFINDHEGFRYEDYLVGEVIPFVRQAFNVVGDRQGWAIGGFSMGGASALMQAIRYPEIFSVVASHSGAFEGPLRQGDPYASARSDPHCIIPSTEIHERVWGPYGSATRRFYNLYPLISTWRTDIELNVYADVGSSDYKRIIQMNRNTADALLAAGILVEYQERDGKHDLEFLNKALPFSLDFVSRKLAPSAG